MMANDRSSLKKITLLNKIISIMAATYRMKQYTSPYNSMSLDVMVWGLEGGFRTPTPHLQIRIHSLLVYSATSQKTTQSPNFSSVETVLQMTLQPR